MLDRRIYPDLGPDGGVEGPGAVVEQICQLVEPLVREAYPHARIGTSKRGLEVSFARSIKGQDPTVDLIVTLTRKDAEGLWIPNLERNDWDASHPEKHTELFTSGDRSLRALRARVIRLVKAETRQRPRDDRSLSSFNISALAWECIIHSDVPLDQALAYWYSYAASELTKANTNDPAGVSDPIKLPLPQATVVQRLSHTAGLLARALEADAAGDETGVRRLLGQVFPGYIDVPDGKAERATILRTGQMASVIPGLQVGAPIKITRAYGADHG